MWVIESRGYILVVGAKMHPTLWNVESAGEVVMDGSCTTSLNFTW